MSDESLGVVVAWKGEWRQTGACRILLPVDWAWDPGSVGQPYDRFVAPTQDLEVFLVALDGAEDTSVAIGELVSADVAAWDERGQVERLVRSRTLDGSAVSTARLPEQGVVLAALYRPAAGVIFGLKAYDHRHDPARFAELLETLDHALRTLKPGGD